MARRQWKLEAYVSRLEARELHLVTLTQAVEGYATVEDVIEIPFSEITRYENQHLATKWLTSWYQGKNVVYGYVLKDVKREPNPFAYSKGPAIVFNIKEEGTAS